LISHDNNLFDKPPNAKLNVQEFLTFFDKSKINLENEIIMTKIYNEIVIRNCLINHVNKLTKKLFVEKQIRIEQIVL